MDNETAQDLGVAATGRDPREAPFGYFSGGTFVLDDSRLFSWFESMDHLATQLLEVEPTNYSIDEENELKVYQHKVAPILEKVTRNGFSEELRLAFNEAAKEFMVIEWWGEFEELIRGQTEFAKGVLSDYLDLDEGAEQKVLAPEDIEDFVEYLQTYGV